MKNITTKINRRLIIIIVAGIFITLFPFFIIGIDAQPPIRVGEDPFGIAYDSGNERMYVTNIRDGTVSVIDTTTNTVIKSINVGDRPIDIAYDSGNKRMYVSNNNNNTVSVIDTTTNKVIDTNPNTPQIDPIKVGAGPEGIAYDPENELIYVTNRNDGTISVISTTTNRVIDTNPNTPQIDPIKVGETIEGIAYDPGNKRMYVTKIVDDTVSVIDTTTNKVIDTKPNTPEIDPIKVGDTPDSIVYDPVNKRMYVTNVVDGTVSVIDTTTNKVIDTKPNTPEIDPIMVGAGPRGIAYDLVNKIMYVANSRDGTVSLIDTTTNTLVGSQIKVGDRPHYIAYDPVNKRMYVTNIRGDTVYVIYTATNTVVGNPITVGDQPEGIAYDPVNKIMYVANTNVLDSYVAIINTTTNIVIGFITVGDQPEGIAYDPVNKRMYVTNRDDNTVSVINTTTNKVIDTNPNTPQIDPIKVGAGPTGIAYSKINELMYVTNRDDGTVSVIDTGANRVIDTNPNTPEIDPIRVGELPQGIAYDNQRKKIYVTNSGDGTVSVMDTITNTVTKSINNVGDGLRGIAYDPVNKRMYVTNPRDGNVSVIDTITNTVTKSINVGDGLRGIAYDPEKKMMYVTNAVDNNVSVIDTATISVIGSVLVGDKPEYIAYDQVNKRMYVTNSSDGTVSPIYIWYGII